jgi:hypothetical protein
MALKYLSFGWSVLSLRVGGGPPLLHHIHQLYILMKY